MYVFFCVHVEQINELNWWTELMNWTEWLGCVSEKEYDHASASAPSPQWQFFRGAKIRNCQCEILHNFTE